ncbi:MAG TPA: hypothetical protein H9726_05800 [Candidatus Borkfalkia avicola]|uniref:Uncharacterized protein n=1 Tax=Candidatus Borkfalkia avicola TaxID=2838503 RepID=A0A9D2D7F5_9FIRM|nr:hypothetical protein [Candidatus Borkfalkia avicola]
MKICKNCGRETTDDKVRCPHCGYLFESDMDDMLRRMRSNLDSYKQEMAVAAPPQGAPVPAQQNAAPQGAAQPYAQQTSDKERFELLTEVAQLKGEVNALHGEISRMQAARAQYEQPPQGAQQPAVVYAQPQYAVNTVPVSGVPGQNGYGYANYATPRPQSAAVRKARSGNRIFLSVVSLLLLGLSIGMFFLTWADWSGVTFKGFDGIRYILGSGQDTGFAAYLELIRLKDFGGSEIVANICENLCYYVVRYGTVVYAAFLVLGFPLLFSMFGRISCKGWHRFVAWMSFIVGALLFGIFCWVSGFSTVTLWFMIGAGANFVRGLFLAFYKGKHARGKGGLQ